MQQKHDMLENFKRNYNIGFNLCLILQRGLVVPCRNKWGTEALGVPCALALVLMFFWAAFSRDPFFWAWIALWFVCYLRRRVEALRLVKTGLHSHYDGWSTHANYFRCSEKTAKLVVEPVLFGILGGILLWVYQECGLPVRGLPAFMLTGVFTIPLVESVKQTIWNKRLQAMNDARVENEAALRDFRERYGDSNRR